MQYIYFLLFENNFRSYDYTGASQRKKNIVAVFTLNRVIDDNLKKQIKNRTLYTCRLFLFTRIFQYISNWSKVFEDLATLFRQYNFLKVSKATKTSKKYHSFTTHFRSKNLIYFTNLNSLDVKNNMLPQHSQKFFWPKNFPASVLLFGVRKKHLHCTISWRPKTAFFKLFKSKCLYIYVYLYNRCFIPKT